MIRYMDYESYRSQINYFMKSCCFKLVTTTAHQLSMGMCQLDRACGTGCHGDERGSQRYAALGPGSVAGARAGSRCKCEM